MNVETIFLLILMGLAAGTLSGLVGVGGGIIIVPALVFFLGFSQQAAQGTSLGIASSSRRYFGCYQLLQQGLYRYEGRRDHVAMLLFSVDG